MKQRIILVAKDYDEFKKFKKLEGFEVFEKEDIRGDFQGWVTKNIKSDKEEVYLLVHFGNIGTEDELCEKIKEWKSKLNKENVTILPISKGAESKKATELYEKVSKCKIPANLEDYKRHWKEKCETFPLRKIIVKLLPFFLDCETAQNYNNFDKMEEKLKDDLIKIKNEKVIEMAEENGFVKSKDNWDQMSNLLDENEKLKEDATIEFIQQKEWKKILNDLK